MADLSAWISFAVFVFVGVGIGAAALPHVVRFLLDHRLTGRNYKGAVIPVGMGLFLWFMLMLFFLLIQCWGMLQFPLPDMLQGGGGGSVQDRFQTFTLALTVIFVLGWTDDAIGNAAVKGISGHWAAWKRDRTITTGLVKAGAVPAVSLWVAAEAADGIWAGLIHFCLLVLATNAINLLDLRPGRACKAFLLLAASLLAVASGPGWILYLLPLLSGALLLLPGDLKARFMLGDTGANFLGFGIGYCMTASGPLWYQAGLAGLLACMHWFAERRSISGAIERRRWLRWLDRWGRAE